MTQGSSFEADYLDEVRRSFRGYKRLADGGLAQLVAVCERRAIRPEPGYRTCPQDCFQSGAKARRDCWPLARRPFGLCRGGSAAFAKYRC